VADFAVVLGAYSQVWDAKRDLRVELPVGAPA